MKRLLALLVLCAGILPTLACAAPVTTTTLPVETTLGNSILYEVNIRDYTAEGTFAAFAAHLPRLRELGVDILWLMPIHPISVVRRIGSLGSWYAVADYRAVNPAYGSLDDFRDLVTMAHGLGFKVILDWVANHTGWDNPWITAHPEWYTHDGDGNIAIPAGTNWNDVADLNYDVAALRDAMVANLVYWVEEFDVDGFRCDYAGGVPRTFWETARTAVDAVKPVFWLAEDETQFHLLDRAFDANFAFSMMDLVKRVAARTADADDLRTLIRANAERYPAGTFPLYYVSNHDVNAWEGSVPDLLGAGEFALSTLIFTLPGMPLLYSGQEIGIDRSLRFFDKDEIDWTGWEDNPTFAFYAHLTALKKNHPALWQEDLDNLDFLANDDPDVLVYARTTGTSEVLVILNLSPTSRFLTMSFAGAEGTYRDWFGGDEVDIAASMSMRLDAWGFRVLVR